jgi:hypothetical protein
MRPILSRLAQIAIGLLLIVIIRSLAEYLWLYTPPAPAVPPDAATSNLLLYIWGAIGAAAGAILALGMHAFGRDRAALAIVAITIVALFGYRLIAG